MKFCIGPVLAILAFVPAVALAQDQSADQFRAAAARLRVQNADVLVRYPAFQAIEDEVRADCGKRVPGKGPDSEFCSCAAAITMALWLGDAPMRAKLRSYSADPKLQSPREFLGYQGPELYSPFCEKAGL
jgi:hypothetical protein